MKEEVPQIALESSAQIDLCIALLQDFIRLFFLVIGGVFSPSVTLVTAKNQHRCWKARAYIRARGLEGSRWVNRVRMRKGRDMRRLEEKRNGGMLESIVIHVYCYMGESKIRGA